LIFFRFNPPESARRCPQNFSKYPPPKVIWLQVENATTAVVANLLRANALLLKPFL
jgi:hypothetical protein